VVEAYMGHVQDNAAESVARVLTKLHDAEFTYPTDQGCAIKVKITSTAPSARRRSISPAPRRSAKNNFNAPEPVTGRPCSMSSASWSRTCDPDECRLPAADQDHHAGGSMLKPRYPAAVVAGNVETSQHVTNALFGALGAMAASAGHDEQPHLRQRRVPVLRDDLLRLAGRRVQPGFNGTDRACTST
jgi:5-oxoprolinase (ATP-hydrolysing)